MRCAVPDCTAEVVMTGVCSAHWLEAEYAALSADLRGFHHEILRARAEEQDRERRQIEEASRARQRRDFAADDRAADRILDRICDRFWTDAADGGRNNALAGAAWAAGRLVAGGELEHDATLNRLVTEATAAGLPWREARDVARGQMHRAKGNPRVLERKGQFETSWAVKW